MGKGKLIQLLKLLSETDYSVKELVELLESSKSNVYRGLELVKQYYKVAVTEIEGSQKYRIVIPESQNPHRPTYKTEVLKFEKIEDQVRQYLLSKSQKGELILTNFARNAGLRYTPLYDFLHKRTLSYGAFEQLYTYVKINYWREN